MGRYSSQTPVGQFVLLRRSILQEKRRRERKREEERSSLMPSFVEQVPLEHDTKYFQVNCTGKDNKRTIN